MPKLLLLAGIGWCATSPLHHTLKRQKIVNTGIAKEPDILSHLDNPDPIKRSVKRNSLYEYKKHKWGNADLIFSEDVTLDNFIEYYSKLVSDEYKYVGEFSNDNSFLSENFLAKIAPKLKDHFDVKVLMITRDPVRRSYSKTSANYQRIIDKQFPDSISYWKHILSLPGQNIFKFSYTDIYKKFSQHFPTHAIVMEELWSGKTKELEDFLGCELNGLHRNCYYPEMGTKAPRYEELPDQWTSDLQDLTDEDYAFGKKHLQWIYDEWFEQFKTRPWN
tara:strand:+ start:9725 stop:10552 length:828 start_codon:yes stop_codon:yes gene_type:complete